MVFFLFFIVSGWDMVSRSRCLLHGFHHGVDDEELVLDRTLVGEPDRQAFQRVDGRAVRRYGLQETQLVELLNNSRGSLSVAPPYH